jgi:hypothetical protein
MIVKLKITGQGPKELYNQYKKYESKIFKLTPTFMQDVPGGNSSILGGHNIGHSMQKMHMCMCPIPNCFRDTGISLHSSKIFDKKEILRAAYNTGIYCSSDKVGTVYPAKYLFKNSIVNINALCNSCEGGPHTAYQNIRNL